MGIVTCAPRDVYGADAWFRIPDTFAGMPRKALPIEPPPRRDGHHAFTHWGFLSDDERSAVVRAAKS